MEGILPVNISLAALLHVVAELSVTALTVGYVGHLAGAW